METFNFLIKAVILSIFNSRFTNYAEKNQILISVKEKMETKYSLIKCWLPGFDYTYAFINTMISRDIYIYML